MQASVTGMRRESARPLAIVEECLAPELGSPNSFRAGALGNRERVTQRLLCPGGWAYAHPSVRPTRLHWWAGGNSSPDRKDCSQPIREPLGFYCSHQTLLLSLLKSGRKGALSLSNSSEWSICREASFARGYVGFGAFCAIRFCLFTRL